MKRSVLIKAVTAKGAKLLRHGANHDIYIQPKNGNAEPIPRHNEVHEFLAKKILKRLS